MNVDPARNGLFLQGGFGTGKAMSDNCEIVDDVPEALTIAAVPTGVQPTLSRGHGRSVDSGGVLPSGVAVPHQLQGPRVLHAAYGFRVSGTWQSLTGPLVAANQIYANAGSAPPPGTTLGRPLTFAQSTVNVVEPGSMYGDRLNQIDLRFTKLVNVGVGRVDFNVDIYNALNSDAILTQQNAYGTAWTRPLTVIQPRFVKFSARWDF